MEHAVQPVPIVRTAGVCRVFKTGYSEVHALRDVTFDAMAEKLVILRGRSGSGKTTLLNIVGALDQPTSGEAFFDGVNLTHASEAERDAFRRKQMGYVFQSFALLPLMSAYENVEFGLRVAGMPAQGRRKRAEECLAFVGLAKRMGHRPFELSGGEQQRVAIARAIVHRPKLILADEPTAELDSRMGLQVINLFRELVDKEHMSIVMTSHDPSVLDIADMIVELSDGEVSDITHNPQKGDA